MSDKNITNYEKKISEQIKQYKNTEDMHSSLGDIFRFWQDTYFRPIFVSVTGCKNYIEFYAKNLLQSLEHCKSNTIYSIGSGDANVEITIARYMKDMGANFKIIGLELSPYQIERAKRNVAEKGLGEQISFEECDINKWCPSDNFSGIIAHHALHHIVELEKLFDNIYQGLERNGVFVTFDVIGRNGHMRWPEALEVIERIWKFLPEEKKYHHILDIVDTEYVNRDCSTQGFEGIRSQDILRLLVDRFEFEYFLGFGNLIDIFTGRGFGPNWNPDEKLDRAFIEFVQYLNDLLIDLGYIKPTRMCAAMVKEKTIMKTYKNWTPEFCLRKPES